MDNLDDFQISFHLLESNDLKLLVSGNNLSEEYLAEIHSLIRAVIEVFNKRVTDYDKNVIIASHQGGKQAFIVFECILKGKKVAVKLYKPIVTHLIVHTVASDYLIKNIAEFNKELQNTSIHLSFPQTYGLGQIKFLDKNLPSISILIQDWIENAEEIHKILPKDHVIIIKSIIKKLTAEKGFMVDIMSKNWLASKTNEIKYIDLILFNPKGQILEQIKYWSKILE
jgi:hypothetical protein